MLKMSRYYSVLYTKKAPNKVAVPAHILFYGGRNSILTAGS